MCCLSPWLRAAPDRAPEERGQKTSGGGKDPLELPPCLPPPSPHCLQTPGAAWPREPPARHPPGCPGAAPGPTPSPQLRTGPQRPRDLGGGGVHPAGRGCTHSSGVYTHSRESLQTYRWGLHTQQWGLHTLQGGTAHTAMGSHTQQCDLHTLKWDLHTQQWGCTRSSGVARPRGIPGLSHCSVVPAATAPQCWDKAPGCCCRQRLIP